MSHHLPSSCRLFSPQHRNKPIYLFCVILQAVPSTCVYGYTRRALSTKRLQAASTSIVVCAGLNNYAYFECHEVRKQAGYILMVLSAFPNMDSCTNKAISEIRKKNTAETSSQVTSTTPIEKPTFLETLSKYEIYFSK